LESLQVALPVNDNYTFLLASAEAFQQSYHDIILR